MTRPLAVLRPEPGNAATARRIEALGLTAIRRPLFAVRPLVWQCPDPEAFDVLLLTSANVLRHAGAQLDRLKPLPVIAVGAATAEAARACGFGVRATGDRDGAAALALAGRARVLHLTGREHADGAVAERIAVYASEPVSADVIDLAGTVALIHSSRAGARLAEITLDRSRVAIAAISAAAMTAAGSGWSAHCVAARPSDASLIDAARMLAD